MAERPPNRNVYITNLPPDITEEKLKEVFGSYGEVTWCRPMKPHEGKCPALIEFASIDEASWVIQNMDGSVPQGLSEPVRVMFARSQEDKMHHKGKGKGYRSSPYGWGGAEDWGAEGWGAMGWGDADDWMAHVVWPPGPPARHGGGANGWSGGGIGVSAPSQSAEPQPSDNVYIRGLPTELTEEMLKQTFSQYGVITQSRILATGNKVGLNSTAALIRFQSVAEATQIVQSLNGKVPAGLTDPIEARFADGPQRGVNLESCGITTIIKGFEASGLMPGSHQYDDSHALYIAGLPSDTTDYCLFRMFAPLGAIAPKGVHAMLNEDGTCKGIAFVNYMDSEAVQQAISVYNGAAMPDGTRLKVAVKMPKKTVPPAAPVPPVVPATAPAESALVVAPITVPAPVMVPAPLALAEAAAPLPVQDAPQMTPPVAEAAPQSVPPLMVPPMSPPPS